MRKAFDDRPQTLNDFQRLHDWGFRDVNLMMTAIKDYGGNITALSGYEVKFFIALSLPKRGEKATLKALFKDRSLEGIERNDLARMFYGYYYDLAPEEREQILHEGFTRYNHDLLAKLSWRMRHQNQVFAYEQGQLALEQGKEENDDAYLFRLPKDSYSLHAIGAAMHNCVASYASNIVQKRSTIVYATHEGAYAMCIEVVGNNVKQAVGNYNAPLAREAKKAFEKWCLSHDLHYSGRNRLHFGDGE